LSARDTRLIFVVRPIGAVIPEHGAERPEELRELHRKMILEQPLSPRLFGASKYVFSSTSGQLRTPCWAPRRSLRHAGSVPAGHLHRQVFPPVL